METKICPSLIFSAVLATACLFIPTAIAEEDELVRLPGQGELRDPKPEQKDRPERLKPGGGLFISFDSDANGAISAAEIATGIPLAFNRADSNGDGFLTALEQREWASDLPTRDDSLANPVRFDPNLDRRVSLDEFSHVINGLASDYLEEGASDILLPISRHSGHISVINAKSRRAMRPGNAVLSAPIHHVCTFT